MDNQLPLPLLVPRKIKIVSSTRELINFSRNRATRNATTADDVGSRKDRERDEEGKMCGTKPGATTPGSNKNCNNRTPDSRAEENRVRDIEGEINTAPRKPKFLNRPKRRPKLNLVNEEILARIGRNTEAHTTHQKNEESPKNIRKSEINARNDDHVTRLTKGATPQKISEITPTKISGTTSGDDEITSREDIVYHDCESPQDLLKQIDVRQIGNETTNHVQGSIENARLTTPTNLIDDNTGDGIRLTELARISNIVHGEPANAEKSVPQQRIRFIGENGAEEDMRHIDEAWAESLEGTANIKTQFPIPGDEIWKQSKQIKAGTKCTIVWTFDRNDEINVSIGKVTRTHSKRGGLGKSSMLYQGVRGYSVGDEFKGTLPPQEAVRVYRILWHQAPPSIDETVRRDSFMENHQLAEHLTCGNEGIDHLPIPTMRTVSPEFIPCVVATLRDIIRNYANVDFAQRNQIWHRLLSAMKLSLVTIRDVDKRSTRRKPFTPKATVDSDAAQDLRAINKAKRLVLEGCACKAAKTLSQKFKSINLSDEEVLDKLTELHPQKPCDFEAPEDAPTLAGVTPEELRSAAKRLAKGVSPGPTGMTDGIVRLMTDDEVSCGSLCHMIRDLLNGFLSKDVTQRLNRARLVAIPKGGGGVRPVAMGEVLNKLAGIVLMQRYEHTLAPLFAPMQQGVFARAGCERIVHKLRERYNKGHSMLAIDFKNAFNSPCRKEIAKHVFAFSALRPFQRFFQVEYAGTSELLFYGSENKLFGVVPSSSGLRQGSPLASLYFCIYMQPI